MELSKMEVRRTEKFSVLCVSGTASNTRVISSPDQTSRGLGSSKLPTAMELKTSSASSSDLNACLVAFRYAELSSTAEVVVDETVPGLELSASTGGGVKGLNAVLRHIAGLNPSAKLEGDSDAEKALVEKWMKAASSMPEDASLLADLEKHLQLETFLAGKRVTLADIVVCCKMLASPASTPSILRWKDACLRQPHFKAVLESNDGTSMRKTEKAKTTKQFSKAKEIKGFEKGNKALDKLSELGIGGVLFAHDVAMTVEEQGKALDGLEGVKTKNLFLRDKKAGLFLVTVRHDRPTDMKTLAKLLGIPGKVSLRFADAETLDKVLAVVQGAVSPLAVVNDVEGQATLALDKELFEVSDVLVHPLRNDRSIRLKAADLIKFVTACGHEPKVLDFSKVKEAPPDPESVTKAVAVKIDPNAAKKAVEKAKLAAKKMKHERADPSSKAGMKKETLLAITASKFDDFSEWYRQVIILSEMIDYYNISGCYILRPWAYQIWEAIQQWMDKEMKKLGVQNSYFPLFVSRRALETEKDHVEGFAAEVAWVTKSGEDDLEEPIAVRPTSETIMYPAFAKWIRSHRDLPLKLNQWSNVVRWEFKDPTPFLRTREFLWQEGHTAHSSYEDADKMVMQALNLYRRVYEELLAVPVIMGTKTEAEKFAGGHKTTTVEAYISGTGRAIQGATSHHLGQNFGKMFKINYEDDRGEMAIPWQTSWGLTTRTIGVCVMCHGDDQGLVLPPRIAPVQVVIVPVVTKKVKNETLGEFCIPIVQRLEAADIRVKYDDRINYTAGWKYNHWEQKGVPIRLEVGPRDLESRQAVIARRDTGEKLTVSEADIAVKVKELLETIQVNLLARLTAERDDHLSRVTEWIDFVPALNRHDIVLTPFCNETEWEEKVKKLSRAEALKDGEVEAATTATSIAAKTLCIPMDQPELPEGTPCFISGKPAKCWVLWGRSY